MESIYLEPASPTPHHHFLCPATKESSHPFTEEKGGE
jgi:hypothetical protein